MLEVGTLLFKFVVVILEHLYQLLEILNTLLVIQLDRLERDSVIVWHICHSAQLAVFSGHIIDYVRQIVDLGHQRVNLLLSGLFLFT